MREDEQRDTVLRVHVLPAAESGPETCSWWCLQERRDICEREDVVQVLVAAVHAGQHCTRTQTQ